MPHKHNPIGSENICGCSRVLRGYMITSYEDIALWHERDISHSSAERIIAPDATELLDYMLVRFGGILKNLTVFPEKMKQDIWLTHGIIFSQRFMLKLIEFRSDVSHEERGYDLQTGRDSLIRLSSLAFLKNGNAFFILFMISRIFLISR